MAYPRSSAPRERSTPHDWRMGEALHARRRPRDKPILLDIGAGVVPLVPRHRPESYENAEIAKIINNIGCRVKVDRDEAGPWIPATSFRDQRAQRTGRVAAYRIPDARREAGFWRHVFSAAGPDGPAGFSAACCWRWPMLTNKNARILARTADGPFGGSAKTEGILPERRGSLTLSIWDAQINSISIVRYYATEASAIAEISRIASAIDLCCWKRYCQTGRRNTCWRCGTTPKNGQGRVYDNCGGFPPATPWRTLGWCRTFREIELRQSGSCL